jgi:filamentous hemagglutinin family protein
MKPCYLLAIPSLISLSIHAEVTLDGTLGHSGALPGPNYLIGADLGRHKGSNLFHSFQDFNLQSHESATFSGPNSVSNIISRVTGGNPSNIDGLIRSTIPNADMYFLNPYGIMFGPNAQLDVQGSFHASTADYLRLGNGGRFDARNPSNSLLTIAPIESFGFLSRQVAPISIQGHGEVTQDWVINKSIGLNVREGKTLSLIGGQIDIWMGTFFKTMTLDDEGNESPEITRLPTLSAPSGRINLASVASQGEVKLGGDFVDVSSFSNLADLRLTEKSPIRTSGEGGGSIFIRGGLFFADDSAIEAKTLGSKDGGVIDIRADAISLINGATLNSDTEGTGKGSNIYVQATESITVAGEHNDIPDNIDKLQESGIYARSGDDKLTDDNLGDGGEIDLEAKNILFKEGTRISVSTYGGGKGGDVTLKASDTVTFEGESSKGSASAVFLRTNYEDEGAGDGGNLLIKANNISFIDSAKISSNTYGKGKGGSVTLKASDTVTFEGESSKGDASGVYLKTYYKDEGAGDGGTLLIEANNISLTDGGYIDSRTLGKGKGSNVTLYANNRLKLTGVRKNGYGSLILATASFISTGGNAGNIFVKAQDVLLTDGAYLIATSFAPGNAGNVHIHATGTITIAGAAKKGWGSTISSVSNPKTEGIIGGEGGNITIEANQLIIKDGGSIAVSSIAPKGIQSSKGGNITIRVQGAVELSGVNPYGENEDGFGSGIYALSIGVEDNAGDAGTIMLQAGSLIIREGAVIISSTNNNAKGGNIDIDVRGAVTITGDASNIPLREPADYQLEYLQEFSPSHYNQSTSGIYASSEGKTDQAGQGSSITLSAQNLTLTNKGKISTSSAGGGKAGNIIIEVAQLQLDSRASIASESRLPNAYDFANLTERDSHILISGDIVKVADIGNGKSGCYINTGENLIRTTPVDTVADLTALYKLTNQYSIAEGDIIEVKDAGYGESARFIYAYEGGDNLEEWVKFDDKVTVTFENMTELKVGWLKPENIPYPSGEVIQVNNFGDGKPAILVYSSGIVDPTGTGDLFGRALRLNVFNVADTTALNELSETAFVRAGDTANVMDVSSRFVFNGQSWLKLNNTLMVTDIAEMNALTVAQIGNIAEIAQVESGQPSGFIYSGREWLPLHDNIGSTDHHHHQTVQTRSELDKLSAKPGELVDVEEANANQSEHFFYADGEWKQQIKGGNAGTLTIIARDGIRLSNNSTITTESISAGGGGINIKTDKLLNMTNSQVTSSVAEGVGSGGDIALNSDFVVMDNSKIIARAYEGHGGNMNITTTGIYRFGDESASPIDASSKLGVDGEVVVNSPDTDISGKLFVLSTEMINAADLMQEPCTSRIAKNLSRFAIRASEGTSNAAGDLLPSGPLLSQIKPIKTTKSMKGTMAKPAVKVTLLAGCQPNLSEPPAHVRKTTTRKRRAVKRSRVIPEEPLF